MAVIVLAEDEVHIARVVQLWLTKERHVVYQAGNGRAALQLVRDHRPDLLITDVNMPVMDGIELAVACAAEGLPKVGTIVLTSRCDQKEIRDRLTGMAVVFHPKPFSPTKLTQEVNQLLSGAKRSVAAAGEQRGVTAR